MKKLILAIFTIIIFATSTPAVTPGEIIDAYLKDSAAAMELYAGQEIEFTGLVHSCVRTFGPDFNVWTIHLSLEDVDVFGYVRFEIPTGQKITMRGECVGLGVVGPKLRVTPD